MLPLSNHHPVAFTAWVGLCYRIATAFGHGWTAAVVIFTASQATLFAAMLAIVCHWIGRRFGRGAAVATIAYFVINPQVGMWAITMHKDTTFIGWTCLAVVLLAEAAIRGPRWLLRPAPLAAFCLLIVGLCFSRNNGVMVAVVLVAIIVLMLLPRFIRRSEERSRWWRLPVVVLPLLACILVIQGPGYRAAGVVPTEKAESLGLPLQQIAWATKYGELTDTERAEVTRIMPLDRMRAKYNPTLSDNLKFDPSFHTKWVNAHTSEVLRTWARIGSHNPAGYGMAWFVLEGRYLDPAGSFHRVDIGTVRGRGDVRLSGETYVGDEGRPQTRMRVAHWVLRFESLPLTNLPFQVPAAVWCSLLVVIAAMMSRRWWALVPQLPWLLMVGTLLVASPIADLRYVGALHVGLPILLALAWAGPALTGADGRPRDGEPRSRESMAVG